MTDSKLRELERRWKETGSIEDEAAYLLERVRVGDVGEEKLELAAYCGHEGARAALGVAPWAPITSIDEWLAWVRGLSKWGHRTCIRAFAAAYGSVSLPLMLSESALTDSPTMSWGIETLAGLEQWLRNGSDHALEAFVAGDVRRRRIADDPVTQIMGLAGRRNDLVAAIRRCFERDLIDPDAEPTSRPC